MGEAPMGTKYNKQARIEQMGTSDEEYQTFWGPKHEQRPKARNILMGTKVMGSASTETTDISLYIQLPALVNGKTHFLTFLIDTESEVTISLAPNNRIL
jgi:hypothetical protein